ncbi:hypothetical protein WJX79_004254 [Trebouxia sp. C0005]
MLDTQSRPASAGSLARTGRQQELGAYLDHNRYGMPSQAPAYGPGNFDARRTMSYVFHLRSATASFGDGGSRVSAGSNAGVTDLSPEDSEFHQFVKDIFGQPVDAGRGSAQQAAAEATTGFQPVRFAAASTDADAIMADNVPHHGQDASDTGKMQYQQGDIVWAKLGSDPYWPARVQKPTRKQHKDSKMGPGKVFVVYFGTNEISALPKNRIKSWGTQPVPRAAVGDLKAAILEARQAVRMM